MNLSAANPAKKAITEKKFNCIISFGTANPNIILLKTITNNKTTTIVIPASKAALNTLLLSKYGLNDWIIVDLKYLDPSFVDKKFKIRSDTNPTMKFKKTNK